MHIVDLLYSPPTLPSLFNEKNLQFFQPEWVESAFHKGGSLPTKEEWPGIEQGLYHEATKPTKFE